MIRIVSDKRATAKKKRRWGFLANIKQGIHNLQPKKQYIKLGHRAVLGSVIGTNDTNYKGNMILFLQYIV